MQQQQAQNSFKHEFNQLQQQQFGIDTNPVQTNHERQYGKYIIVTRKANGEPSMVLGPHWYIFAFSFLGTIALNILMLYSLRKDLNPAWFYILIISAIVYAYAYLRIGLSNPGFAQPNPNLRHDNLLRVCQTCGVAKIRDVYHCPDCNICIEGYDHHCPWIGKCVGAKNLHSFYFFLIMIFGNLILCFIATIASGNLKQSQNQTGKQIIMG